jgi:hypothetical protein
MHRYLSTGFTVIVAATLLVAAPARAELNAYYSGVDRMTGSEVPATVQYSIAKNRVALVIHGSTDSRMLFLEDQELLRYIDDT